MERIDMQPQCYSYIRFSTPEQLKGDSLRRQLELSETFAKENGLELDTTLSMRDLGLSAFHGHHRAKGALGQFLRLVHDGRVAKDSVLLVESLDRLSREDILKAVGLFTDLVNSGIKIVTLADNREFTKDSINANPMDLMMSLVVLSRGHEESQMKSKRIKAAWNGKRQKISKRKLTARCPAWLKLSKDKTQFTAIPERVHTINHIFRMKLEGIGSETISVKLNREEEAKSKKALPCWIPKPMRKDSTGGWRKSYIDKIIRNRSVLGEYQPHMLVEGKSVPTGEPVKDYYPQIVSDQIFYGVQDLLSRNRHKGGKNGKVSNLFGHIAKCGYCGAPMQFINKGPAPKGYQYLVCDTARRGRGCDYHSIRYKDFEKVVLQYCQGLTVQDILPSSGQALSEVQTLQYKLSATKAHIVENETKINNLTDSIATTSDKRVRGKLETSLSAVFNEQEQAQKEEKTIQRHIKKLSSSNKSTQAQINSTKELLALLDSENDEGQKEIRLRLKNRLRNLISKINVYGVGMFRAIIQKSLPTVNPAFANQVKSKLDNGDYDKKDQCAFVVHFETGNWQKLTPYQPFELASEFNEETGVTMSIGWGIDGTPTVEIDKEKEIK